MNFKDPTRHQVEWWQIHPKLRLILCDMELWLADHGTNMVITELLRDDETQLDYIRQGFTLARTSVHQFGRGADIRKPLDPGICEMLAEYINKKYPYDVTRPGLTTLLWHGKVAHGHVQVIDM